jgi:hypothetical protein
MTWELTRPAVRESISIVVKRGVIAVGQGISEVSEKANSFYDDATQEVVSIFFSFLLLPLPSL